MKICLDIQASVAQTAGVGRYVRLLAEHLLKCAGTDQLSFFHFDFMRRGVTPPLPNTRAIHWCPGRIAQLCWKTLKWPPFDLFAGRADLYHFPNFIMPPVASGKCVVSIHDASFLRYPEFTEKRNLAFLRHAIADTVRRADAIITISRFSADELGFFFPEARRKIHVIYPGIMEHMSQGITKLNPNCHSHDQASPERFAQARNGNPSGKDGLDSRLRGNDRTDLQTIGLNKPYILTVGTLEPRKNIEFLVMVYENMKEFKGDLVIVGRRGWKYASILDRIASSSRASEIRLLENIGNNELAAIYEGAALFMFPSIYEGFGFPPLEACACGTPVISSTGGSLKEALGEGALLMEKFDHKEWAKAAQLMIGDRLLRQSFIDKGRRQAAKYSWHEAARETMALYRRIGA